MVDHMMEEIFVLLWTLVDLPKELMVIIEEEVVVVGIIEVVIGAEVGIEAGAGIEGAGAGIEAGVEVETGDVEVLAGGTGGRKVAVETGVKVLKKDEIVVVQEIAEEEVAQEIAVEVVVQEIAVEKVGIEVDLATRRIDQFPEADLN